MLTLADGARVACHRVAETLGRFVPEGSVAG
jgi:hypothetical protein